VGETCYGTGGYSRCVWPFSILERIDVGETRSMPSQDSIRCSFSILERIDVGETSVAHLAGALHKTFSILERIDVGETKEKNGDGDGDRRIFQYPRTDRRG